MAEEAKPVVNADGLEPDQPVDFATLMKVEQARKEKEAKPEAPKPKAAPKA